MGVGGLRLADENLDPEAGVVGAALLVALIAMFVAALVVPGVFDDEGVLFGAAFFVCAMHLTLYALAGRGNRDLLGVAARLAHAARGDPDSGRGLHRRRTHLALARRARAPTSAGC